MNTIRHFSSTLLIITTLVASLVIGIGVRERADRVVVEAAVAGGFDAGGRAGIA